MSSPPAAGVSTTQLKICPRCGYSLFGLPRAGRCPECGFTYDEHTFVLTGIARGMSTTAPGRVVLWLVVVGLMPFVPTCAPMVIFSGGSGGAVVSLVLLAGWIALLVYLLATGKKEKKGMEPFLFAASGFGSCTAGELHSPQSTFRLTTWEQVNSVRLDRLGRTWHRLRIGWSTMPGTARFQRVMLDAGVSCDENEARMVRYHLDRLISLAHGVAIAPPALPKAAEERLLDWEEERR